MYSRTESDRRYNRGHKKEIKEKHRRWYEKNCEKVLKKQKQYCKNNRGKRREREKRRRKIDLKFSLNNKMTTAIRISLKGDKRGRHWETIIDYILDELIEHLKKTMPKGYNWQDYLQGKLHIDHIIPVSVFNFDSPDHIDFKRCWALGNPRLLPAKENQIKSNKLKKPFQLSLKV